MISRDRSAGWQHAKVSGHRNEELLANSLAGGEAGAELSRVLGLDCSGMSVDGGGLGEKRFASVIGSSPTPSKTDLKVHWDEPGFTTRISLKKSAEGQAFMIGADRFLAGFEGQFSCEIPTSVQRALRLYLGYASDSEARLASVPAVSTRIRAQEEHHGHRMVWETLARHDAGMAEDLLQWIRDNLADIVRFTFARGLVTADSEWADLLVYSNWVDPDVEEALTVFDIEDLAVAAASRPELVFPGPRNGGSTILLPFGSLQWHQNEAQLRHKLDKILNLLPPVGTH